MPTHKGANSTSLNYKLRKFYFSGVQLIVEILGRHILVFSVIIESFSVHVLLIDKLFSTTLYEHKY